MLRIFFPGITATTDLITIKGEKAKYLSVVLRLKEGDQFIITNEKGDSYFAKIIGKDKNDIKIKITGKRNLNTESPLHITLIQGILKGEKMDLVIQKATELGINEIIPAVTERSQIRATRKIPRWKKIAEEASRQSGRNIIPTIHEALDFRSLFDIAGLSSGSRIIFWERGGEFFSDVIERLKNQTKVILFTGPEGGLSEKEIITASNHGFITATLGRRILRAETAAIAALSIIQYELGDLGSNF